MNIKQFICGLFGHHWSLWIPGVNGKREFRWCCTCYKRKERPVI